jgi:hypothetical protein
MALVCKTNPHLEASTLWGIIVSIYLRNVLNIYSILDHLLVILISLYAVAFLSGYLKQSEKSPAMIWMKTKYPKSPKILMYLGVFVILNHLVRLVIELFS